MTSLPFLVKNLSFLGHISLNHSGETDFDILRSDFAGHELLSSSLPLTDSMASLILFVSSMSDQSTRGRRAQSLRSQSDSLIQI